MTEIFTWANGVLQWSQGFLLLLYPVVAYILTKAALERPRIWSLVIMALAADAIVILELVSALSIANMGAGFPIPPEIARFGFRLAANFLGLIPLLFLWVYRTGRFADGHDIAEVERALEGAGIRATADEAARVYLALFGERRRASADG